MSVRLGDRGYCAEAFRARVFFNGEELRACFTADEEKREAHCYAADERGQLIVDGDHVREEIKRGRVEITILPKGEAF